MAVGKNAFILAAFAVTLAWTAVLAVPDNRTHIWTFGSKSDLSLIVKSPEGRFALVNPSTSSSFYSELGEKLPFYQHRIDLVILTKSKSSGPNPSLENLKKHYEVGQVMGESDSSSITEGNKSDQYGEKSLLWSTLVWQTFRLPGEDGVVRLAAGSSSLLFVTRGNVALWRALPGWAKVTYLVGPISGAKSDDQVLTERFQPQFMLHEGSEIVW